jgi:hypothetical protein
MNLLAEEIELFFSVPPVGFSERSEAGVSKRCVSHRARRERREKRLISKKSELRFLTL